MTGARIWTEFYPIGNGEPLQVFEQGSDINSFLEGDSGATQPPKGEMKVEGVWLGLIATACLVLTPPVHRDLGCFFSWLGNQSMCLSHPRSLLGCVASVPCSHMLRGSPWWPRMVSPSTSPPRCPSQARVCKCTTAYTTNQTVSTKGEGPLPLCCPQMCTNIMRLGHSEVAMCVHTPVCTHTHSSMCWAGSHMHAIVCVVWM